MSQPSWINTNSSNSESSTSDNIFESASLEILPFQLGSFASETGVFFLLSLIGVTFLLDQVHGRMFRLKIFLMNRDFLLITNPKLISFINVILGILCWVFLLLPFIAIAVWSWGLIIRSSNLDKSLRGGLCVLTVGLSFILYDFGMMNIKWNNYRFTKNNMIVLAVAHLSLTAYQFIAIIGNNQKENFFGLSSIFLSANCILMIILVFLNSGLKHSSMKEFLANLEQGQPKDDQRDTNFEEEIQMQREDQNFIVTQSEVNDLFTIAHAGDGKVNSAFGGGIQKFIISMDPKARKIVTFVIWGIAGGILIVYAFVVYYQMDKSKLGFVTLIAVLVTDLILYLFYKSKSIRSASLLSVTLLINRVLLFVFGGKYWLYGYLILYVFYGFILTKVIGEKRFPFESGFKNIKVRGILDNLHKVNIAQVPEFLLALITFIYIALIAILLAVDPDEDTVPTPPITIGKVEYQFYTVGIFALILVFLILCIYCTFRLFQRKKKGIQSRMYYYVLSKRLDTYWIFYIATFVLVIAYVLIAYWASKNVTLLIVGIFGVAAIMLYFNGYLYYQLNDYKILQNIQQLNVRIRRHNQKIAQIKSQATLLKDKIAQGDAGALGVQNELALELLRKREQEKEKQRSIRLRAQHRSPLKVQKNLQQVAPSHSPSKFNVQRQPNPTNVVEETKSNASNFNQRSNRKQERQSDELDKIIDNELMKKKYNNPDEDDGIYEGGEEEKGNESQLDQSQIKNDFQNTQQLQNLLDADDSDEELDPEQEDNVDQAVASRRVYRPFPDWRDTHTFFGAYFKRKLRGNDYQIINSLLAATVSLAVMALILCAKSSSVVGVTYIIPFIHYGLAYFTSSRSLNTDAQMSVVEYLFFALAYMIQYGWGVVHLITFYQTDQLLDDTESSYKMGRFIVVYLLMIPSITSVVSAIGKWIDDKGKFTPALIVQIVISFIQILLIIACCYILISFVSGVIVSALTIAVVYVVFQVWIYIKNEYYFPYLWQVTNAILAALIVIASFIVSLFVGDFSNFFGFSISLWTLAFFILLYAFSELFTDIQNFSKRPVFFSPWVFPVFIYNPKKNDVESHNLPAVAFIVGMVILMLWSTFASVWITPVGFGVSICSVLEILLIIVVLFLISLTPQHMKLAEDHIDVLTIKNAWLESKQGYISGKGAPNREQLVSYIKMKQRRDDLRNHLRIMERRQTLNLEERWEGMVFKEMRDINLQWVEDYVNLQSFNSCYAYLYEVEKDLNKAYVEELELIIQFQLLVIQHAENLKEVEKKYLFTFLQEKKSALYTFGISLNIPDQGTLETRYARVIAQVQRLSPEKQTMFNSLKEAFTNEQRNLEEKVKERERKANIQQKERLEQMSQFSEEKKRQLDNLDPNLPIHQMPDCELKYQKIVQEGKQGNVFSDNLFKPDNKSLGDKCLDRGVTKWVRARDIPGAVLYQDDINHEDVEQGALGDCYFLSAISVLGEKGVRDIIIQIDPNNSEEWKQCGAFCVKFFKDGYLEYVIIDDYFPAMANGRWVFVRGGKDGKELWPMVLEKAYAKMYGTYSFIEGGKVQYALADMTDGFPEQIELKSQEANIQVFWEKLKNLKSHGCLMGAGSPENPRGDAAINELGIVQGHAYSVIDVQEVDNNRLVQLRNPHGNHGSEWKGDWADDDVAKWTDRLKNRLKFQDKADGIFWMDVLDFIGQFKYLYICRILDKGWTEIKRKGEWRGSSAEGLPTREYPKAKLELNPQYAITITKPCNGFISVTQMDKENIFRGKHYIFFMVSKVNGEKITRVDKNSLLCRSGNPTNMNTITSECDFDRSVNYPYTFTLLVANSEHGAPGEGQFEVLAYSTDPNMKVEQL